MNAPEPPFVSRAGEKLDAALTYFDLDVTGLICADFGSHVGGFVDCLLRRGAGRVYAVDPGRGVLDARLRGDPRVRACEGVNALRFESPEPCDLITIDVGWTAQRLILPAARRSLKAGGHVLTLVKPQYEAPRRWLRRGVLPADRLADVLTIVRRDVLRLGWTLRGEFRSPLAGRGGNVEVFWLLEPPASTGPGKSRGAGRP